MKFKYIKYPIFIEILKTKNRIPCVIFLNNNFFVVIIQNEYFFKIITTILLLVNWKFAIFKFKHETTKLYYWFYKYYSFCEAKQISVSCENKILFVK